METETISESGASNYRSGLHSAVRGLWSGALDGGQFVNAMTSTVDRGVTMAWYEGLKECGIQPSEQTFEEQQQLRDLIAYELQWVPGFRIEIETNSKANGGKLAPLFSRAEIWAGRYSGTVSAARAMACANQKLEWVQGPTSDQCRSCTVLNGKVKRASYWNEKGILPRVHGAWYLECKGFRCLCELVPTDKPLSRGPLPKLP